MSEVAVCGEVVLLTGRAPGAGVEAEAVLEGAVEVFVSRARLDWRCLKRRRSRCVARTGVPFGDSMVGQALSVAALA